MVQLLELLPLLTPLELELEPEPELEPHWLVDSSEPSELRPFASAASGWQCIIAMVRAFREQSASSMPAYTEQSLCRLR